MKVILLTGSLCLALGSLSLADEPATPPAPSAASAASASTTTAPATPPPAASEAAGPDASEAQVKQIRTQGYKPQKRKDGTTLWCKSDALLGSRIQTTTSCASAQDILQRQQNAQDALRNVQRVGTASAAGARAP